MREARRKREGPYPKPLIFVRVLSAAVDEERWSLYRHYTIPVPWMMTVPLFGFVKRNSESRYSNEIFEGLRWLRSEGVAFLQLVQVNLHASGRYNHLSAFRLH